MSEIDELKTALAAERQRADGAEAENARLREAIVSKLTSSPVIEELTPLSSEWDACETIADRYALMKWRVKQALGRSAIAPPPRATEAGDVG